MPYLADYLRKEGPLTMDEGSTLHQLSEWINKSNNENASILIVDDEATILHSLTEILALSDTRFTVDMAGSAEEALDKVSTKNFDLIITDLMLPKMSGLELTQNVKERFPDTCAILMTAYGNKGVMECANENGCAAYIEKPFEIDQLITYVQEILRPQSKARAELTGVTLADVVRIFEFKKQSGVLALEAKEGSGSLGIKDGTVVYAQFGSEQGAEAIATALGCKNLLIKSTQLKLPQIPNVLANWKVLSVASVLTEKTRRVHLLKGIYFGVPKDIKRDKDAAVTKTPRHGEFLEGLNTKRRS